MNKKITIGILGMLFLATVVLGATGMFNIDREIEVTDKELEIATARGIDNYKVNDTFTEDTFRRCLISMSYFRLPCSKEFDSYKMVCELYDVPNITLPEGISEDAFPCTNEVRVNLTNAQMDSILDIYEESTIDLILKVEGEREIERNITLVREGNVTLKTGKVVMEL